MSQMIADLFHRKPLGKKVSRTRMAQRVGPMMPNGRFERTQPFANRFPKRRAAQRTIGSMQREKDMTGRMVQPHFLQITQDRLAYRMRQRILLSSPGTLVGQYGLSPGSSPSLPAANAGPLPIEVRKQQTASEWPDRGY